MNGLGKGTGNVATEQVAAALKILLNIDTGVDISKLWGVSGLVRDIAKLLPAYNAPVVGDRLFWVESGVVVDAFDKLNSAGINSAMTPYMPQLVGRPGPEIKYGAFSGNASLKYYLRQHDYRRRRGSTRRSSKRCTPRDGSVRSCSKKPSSPKSSRASSARHEPDADTGGEPWVDIDQGRPVRRGRCRNNTRLEHSQAALDMPLFPDQYRLRRDSVLDYLRGQGLAPAALDAVAARGGRLKPIPSGVYRVNEAMVRHAGRDSRDSTPPISPSFWRLRWNGSTVCPALPSTPLSVDEMDAVAKITGLAGLERSSLSHTLSMKAVAKRASKELGIAYERRAAHCRAPRRRRLCQRP